MYNISYIQAIQSELEAINLRINKEQSIDNLIDLGGQISSWIAFSGDMMSNTKRLWRKEIARAYESYVFSKAAQNLVISPSMATKYAEAKSGDWEADYELCERVNRTLTHTLEFLRTVISALKQEKYSSNFQPS